MMSKEEKEEERERKKREREEEKRERKRMTKIKSGELVEIGKRSRSPSSVHGLFFSMTTTSSLYQM